MLMKNYLMTNLSNGEFLFRILFLNFLFLDFFQSQLFIDVSCYEVYYEIAQGYFSSNLVFFTQFEP